ncbi:uncharacterized protein EAF02_002260 [Botrytis sinoallii]|uniref:uncharacterized protein n=1 Tax=Botrytis sinoallii TaxID=1463999 RepID=UPI0018FF2F96|nr:uncharacterized protein EAF02_002260 [Botrytis sinoallii]KAF7889845.1 hypothetical protein EAF02_002260 [Botrytis sinoallii]
MSQTRCNNGTDSKENNAHHRKRKKEMHERDGKCAPIMFRKLLQGVGHEFQSLSTICNRGAVPASRNIWDRDSRKGYTEVLVLTIETAMRRSLHKGRTKSSKPVSDATASLTDARKVRGKQGYAK